MRGSAREGAEKKNSSRAVKLACGENAKCFRRDKARHNPSAVAASGGRSRGRHDLTIAGEAVKARSAAPLLIYPAGGALNDPEGEHGIGDPGEASDIGSGNIVPRGSVFISGFQAPVVDAVHDFSQSVLRVVKRPRRT